MPQQSQPQPDLESLVFEAVTAPPAMKRERWGRVEEAIVSMEPESTIDEGEERAPPLKTRFQRMRAAWHAIREQAQKAARGEADPDKTLLEAVRRHQRELAQLLHQSWYVDLGGEG